MGGLHRRLVEHHQRHVVRLPPPHPPRRRLSCRSQDTLARSREAPLAPPTLPVPALLVCARSVACWRYVRRSRSLVCARGAGCVLGPPSTPARPRHLPKRNKPNQVYLHPPSPQRRVTPSYPLLPRPALPVRHVACAPAAAPRPTCMAVYADASSSHGRTSAGPRCTAASALEMACRRHRARASVRRMPPPEACWTIQTLRGPCRQMAGRHRHGPPAVIRGCLRQASSHAWLVAVLPLLRLRRVSRRASRLEPGPSSWAGLSSVCPSRSSPSTESIDCPPSRQTTQSQTIQHATCSPCLYPCAHIPPLSRLSVSLLRYANSPED